MGYTDCLARHVVSAVAHSLALKLRVTRFRLLIVEPITSLWVTNRDIKHKKLKHPQRVFEFLVGVHGLEPRYTESESAVLPLNYTPMFAYTLYTYYLSFQINNFVNKNLFKYKKTCVFRFFILCFYQRSKKGEPS